MCPILTEQQSSFLMEMYRPLSPDSLITAASNGGFSHHKAHRVQTSTGGVHGMPCLSLTIWPFFFWSNLFTPIHL